MKKILITSLFAIILITNQLNAEEVKQTKQVKETKKKELSAEDKKLVDEIMKSQKDIEALDKAQKTVDEIKDKLSIDKK